MRGNSLHCITDSFSSTLFPFPYKRAEIELVNLSVCSKQPLFSTLPQRKINSACADMSYHATNSELVKKMDNKKKTIKMIQNQQPGEDTRTAITELQKELDDIKEKNSDLERAYSQIHERKRQRQLINFPENKSIFSRTNYSVIFFHIKAT